MKKTLTLYALWGLVMTASVYAAARHDNFVDGMGDPIAVVRQTDGSVQYRARDLALWDYVAEKQSLYDGQMLATGRGASTLVEFDSQRSIELSENTLIVISNANSDGLGGLTITLLKGQIRAATNTGSGNGRQIAVLAGNMSVPFESTGVRFELRHSPGDRDVTLSVSTGEVLASTGSEPPVVVRADSEPVSIVQETPKPRLSLIDFKALAMIGAIELTPKTEPGATTTDIDSQVSNEMLSDDLIDANPAIVAAAAHAPRERPQAASAGVKPSANKDISTKSKAPAEPQLAMATTSVKHQEIAESNERNPLFNAKGLVSARYGIPLLEGGLVSKTTTVNLKAVLYKYTFGGPRLDVDYWPKAEDQIDGVAASLQGRRVGLGFSFVSNLDRYYTRLEFTPRLQSAKFGISLPTEVDGGFELRQLNTRNLTLFGAEAAAEVGSSNWLLRLASSRNMTFGGPYAADFTGAEGQLIYNLSKDLEGRMTSLLLSTNFERLKFANTNNVDPRRDLKFADLEQVYASFGALIAW